MNQYDHCSFGNPGQLGIGGAIRDHIGTMLRAYFKHAEAGFAIQAEMLALKFYWIKLEKRLKTSI